jgi:hypothetical protein
MRLLVIVLTLAASGCMSTRMVLMKDRKGNIAQCQANGAYQQAGGYIAVSAGINDCVRQYEALGYERVEAEGKAEAGYGAPSGT